MPPAQFDFGSSFNVFQFGRFRETSRGGDASRRGDRGLGRKGFHAVSPERGKDLEGPVLLVAEEMRDRKEARPRCISTASPSFSNAARIAASRRRAAGSGVWFQKMACAPVSAARPRRIANESLPVRRTRSEPRCRRSARKSEPGSDAATTSTRLREPSALPRPGHGCRRGSRVPASAGRLKAG